VSELRIGGARFGIGLDNQVPLVRTIELACLAEELGLSDVWVPEVNHGRSGTTAAAAIALNTSRIDIGIGVLNMFWRHPSLLAMEAATLDELSGGRLRFGIGPSIWSLRNLGEADERTRKPLTATIETIHQIRALLAGEDGIDATLFPNRRDGRLDFVPIRPRIPLYIGAVNEKMLEAAGELADGVELGSIASLGYARWARERVEAGLARAGRPRTDFDFLSLVLISVDRDGAAARRAVRRVIAYYLYRVEGVVASQSGGDPAAIADAHRAWPDLGADAATDRLSEDLIDVFAAAGTPEQVHERLTDYAAIGLDGVLAWWSGLGPDPEAGLRLLADELRSN
jgi:5,10-methylenetetrahydromethanopterin reductase